MNYADPELRDRLAAEYALGTLRGPARRRFERLLSGNAHLRDLVHDWEQRVNLLAESAPSVAPPPRMWEGIAQRIEPTGMPGRESLLKRLWDSLGFWRGAGLLAAAGAAALALYVALQQPPGAGGEEIAALDQRLARIEGTIQGLAAVQSEIGALDDWLAGIESRLDATVPAASHVAVLIDKYSRPMMTADLDAAEGRLVLQLHITPPRDFTGKTLEVWLAPPGGTSRSLGLLSSEKGGTTTVLILPPETAQSLATAALAVSLEPSGGSITGSPTGPVLFSGPVVPVDL